MNKIEAARTLETEIYTLADASKKASILIQELQDEYFCKPYDVDNELDRMYMANDFDRYGTYANMISDYIFTIKKAAQALDKLSSMKLHE